MSDGLFNKIRKVVKKIPKGKVATYGQIAKMVGTADARKVGWALYGNQDPKIPCHRVVKKDGSLAENYSLGGWKEQANHLTAEGIKLEKPQKVNLTKYRWLA